MVCKVENDLMYMAFARTVAERSQAVRRKVGCVIVNGDALVFGWNGMPQGFDNACEHAVLSGSNKGDGSGYIMHLEMKTNPEVSHAEMNAIGKLAESTISAKGAVLYCTAGPCLECAKLIQRTGIVEVVYADDYRTEEGLYLLQHRGILTRKISG